MTYQQFLHLERESTLERIERERQPRNSIRFGFANGVCGFAAVDRSGRITLGTLDLDAVLELQAQLIELERLLRAQSGERNDEIRGAT